jgi:hypothetical protein
MHYQILRISSEENILFKETVNDVWNYEAVVWRMNLKFLLRSHFPGS